MGNGHISYEAVTSCSETQQNPAHLGEKPHWCSSVKSAGPWEISLLKKQRITGAIVDVVCGQQNIKGVALLAKSGTTWHHLSAKQVMTLLHTFLILAVSLRKMCSDCKTTLLRITQRVLWSWEIELNCPSFFRSMFVSSITLLRA